MASADATPTHPCCQRYRLIPLSAQLYFVIRPAEPLGLGGSRVMAQTSSWSSSGFSPMVFSKVLFFCSRLFCQTEATLTGHSCSF